MSEVVKDRIEAMMYELRNEAATALAQLAYEKKHFPWRNDVKPGNVYEKRALAALQAEAHLLQEMGK